MRDAMAYTIETEIEKKKTRDFIWNRWEQTYDFFVLQ